MADCTDICKHSYTHEHRTLKKTTQNKNLKERDIHKLFYFQKVHKKSIPNISKLLNHFYLFFPQGNLSLLHNNFGKCRKAEYNFVYMNVRGWMTCTYSHTCSGQLYFSVLFVTDDDDNNNNNINAKQHFFSIQYRDCNLINWLEKLRV